MQTVLKIAILGAECTGKTTLLSDMAAHLRARGARVSVVDDVLRQWCAAKGRTPHAGEQAAILHAQIAAVDAAAGCDYLLCDTTPLMTAVYSDLLFGDPSLYPLAVAQQRRYPLALLAASDLPWQADGIQRDGSAAQDQVDRRLREVLQTHALPFYPVCGLGAARLACAMAVVAQFRASCDHAGVPI
jgi:nicotinamide riboside kinase